MQLVGSEPALIPTMVAVVCHIPPSNSVVRTTYILHMYVCYALYVYVHVHMPQTCRIAVCASHFQHG